ncbi:MAG: phosphoglycerate kinase [Chloroflexota bacterium]|nr:phosphoglycerate kinase [Chloroflexota bacterium]
MAKRTLSSLDVAGKRVLVRVDFNIPIEQGVEVIASYDQRLRATLPTIHYLLERDCRIILCSHLGRPGGQVVEALRMAPVGDRLAELLGHPVQSLGDCVGPEVEAEINSMAPGHIVLLENLRFHAGEEKNDPGFVAALASLADCFVMDAFAVTHRAHASTAGITSLLPSAMGLLVQREVEQMGRALESPGSPLAALMGGAKVSDKILVLENILDKLDHLFIGGGMAVTFLNAQGYRTGASSIEADRLDFARDVIGRASARNIGVHLPTDLVVASSFEADPPETRTVPSDQVPEGWYIMDVGEATAARYALALKDCRTIIWNGPMGVFEMPRFSAGTRVVANAIAGLPDVTTVVGGGSTAEAVEELGLMDSMTHVSTGGGASLEFLEGRELPGIAALPDA